MKTPIFVVASLGLAFAAVGGSLVSAADGGGQEPGHPSGKVITSLATAGSTTIAPTVAIIVFDPEHFHLDQLPTAISKSL